MATMYALFFSILFSALCSNLGDFHRAVVPAETPSCSVISDTSIRSEIMAAAQNELGVREVTGENDGERVETYLRYTGLGKGHAWCAAFVSFCYGQAGLSEPRNPWSPALFPNAKTYCRGSACQLPEVVKAIRPADVFGLYGQREKRINHVGLVRNIQGNYVLTIEGNSNNQVESKRRHRSTLYALANWVGGTR